jgi:hypothetical protein
MGEDTQDSSFLSALVTEHFALQSTASTTVSEAAARASLYMFTLSSSLVAMGFIAQTPDVFTPFVATVLPAVFVLGWFTFVRLVDTTVENNRSLRAITRIRGYYRTLSPDGPRYFPAWDDSDDAAKEALAMLGTRPSWTTVLFTTASMVATINGLVGGVGVALLVWKAAGSDSQPLAITIGAVVAGAVMVTAYVYQVRRYSRAAAADRLRFAPQPARA